MIERALETGYEAIESAYRLAFGPRGNLTATVRTPREDFGSLPWTLRTMKIDAVVAYRTLRYKSLNAARTIDTRLGF
ncbi:MAG: hypothetical protein OXR66_03870 [Candidatus Woesearchaeota archaeon]|nr:hypothetical protein [Candidatus Woesearchaeota archaeon]